MTTEKKTKETTDVINADTMYQNAVREVLELGTRKPNRTGVDTISLFGLHYSVNMDWGFPLLTTKKINFSHIVVEMLWFLQGRQNINFLKKHGVKFWDAWADEDGQVPSAYGNFWRFFPVQGMSTATTADKAKRKWAPDFNDQLKWVIDEIKRNPMSRRLVVSAWYPENAQTSKLPPCHVLFVFNVQLDEDGNQTLNLHLTQRSCDMMLGVPYNLASYALLLELVGRFTGIKTGTFSHILVDAHVYTSKKDGDMGEFDHVPNALIQIAREPRVSPTLTISDSIQTLEDVEELFDAESTLEIMDHFKLDRYDPWPALKFKVAV